MMPLYLSHITLLSFFRIFTTIPLLHSDGTVSWSHMLAKCFSRHCILVNRPASKLFCCYNIDSTWFPILYFFVLPWWFHLCRSNRYLTLLISFPSLSTTKGYSGCGRFSISSKWPFHLLAAQGLAIFVLNSCCSSFSFVTYHPCYSVYWFHVPFICC